MTMGVYKVRSGKRRLKQMSLVVLTVTTLIYVYLFNTVYSLPQRSTLSIEEALTPRERNIPNNRQSEEDKNNTLVAAVFGYNSSSFASTRKSKAPLLMNRIKKKNWEGQLREVNQKSIQRFRNQKRTVFHSPVLLKGQVWEPQPNMPNINRDIDVKMNPTTCDTHEIDHRKGLFLLILVLSAVKNYEERMAIRKTYASIKRFHDREIRHVFLLAQVDDVTEMLKVSIESDKFSDIAQFDFKDTYRNLTMKTVAGLAWVSENCKTRFVLKTDDDILVFSERVVGFLEGLSKAEEDYLYSGCTHHGAGAVNRNPTSKFYVSESVYPYRNYPPYNFGLGVLMSKRVVELFALTWKKVPFIPAEDAYLGLLAKATGIVPTCNKAITCNDDTNNKYFLNQVPTFCNFANVMLIPRNFGPQILKQSWEDYAKIMKRGKRCWTRNYFYEKICDWYPKEYVLPKS